MILFKKMLLLFLICLLFINFSQYSYGEEKKKNVLLVYDHRANFGSIEDIVTSVRELLGHFNVSVTEKNVEDYKEHEIEKYDYVFIIGIEGDFINVLFMEDIKKTKKVICWMGKGVEKFLKENERIHLAYKGEFYNFIKVNYKNNSCYITNNEDIKAYNIVDGKSENIKVYAWVDNGEKSYPYIIQENNFYYISRVEINSELFYIIGDFLYDVFGEENIGKSRVYVRIEDVHPFRDVKKLKAVGEYLYKKNIPFMIALIPAYKDPETGYITLMSDNKEFVETIKYLQELGGSVVLHGFTHQAFGGEVTGEGFEFWDGINDKPLSVDINEWIYTRVGKGIEECVKNDIYPLAFEAPHYAMSQEGYKVLKKYFSTYIGQVQTSDAGFVTVSYPYNLYDTNLFYKLVPENLGYVDPDNPLAIYDIFDNFSKISMVRGYTAGVFFHPYLDINYLKTIVGKFEDKKVEFYDLRKENNWVKWEDIYIRSENGEIIFQADSYGEKDTDKKSYFYIGINILSYFVLIFCLIFLVIFIVSNKKNKDLFR
ncbi:DUF2334 domain-containing protein [Crassaminicella thermophila]|uniref:DUF2334 domain-containing protein n=1 Tax=Crassaminicella thermophila TaxID=2599308 RepID=A0A5C0SEI2_CRATE|nr:polysaccharide deacetylase family protein [Crassaminicella thermophila]QEK12843.1 DUF2334 domain-containing protein [Crassaminicella thermophila]